MVILYRRICWLVGRLIGWLLVDFRSKISVWNFDIVGGLVWVGLVWFYRHIMHNRLFNAKYYLYTYIKYKYIYDL